MRNTSKRYMEKELSNGTVTLRFVNHGTEKLAFWQVFYGYIFNNAQYWHRIGHLWDNGREPNYKLFQRGLELYLEYNTAQEA